MIRLNQTPKTSESQRQYMKEYYKRNKAKLRKEHKAYYQSNKTSILKKEKENRDPVRKWAYMLEYKFDITVEKYQAMFDAQKGLCLICGRPPKGRFKRLAVDHCHKTGKVRGLLCVTCNRAIGYLRDDPDIVDKASAYLRSHR